jgi:hypothetical protein
VTVEQALRDSAEHQERYIEPELHRVRGELLIEANRDADGVAALERALATAVAGGARALTLRALLALDRTEEIDRLLAELDPGGSDPEPLLAQARAARRSVASR